MSVLIKGMEMPKSCFYCPFRRKINPDDIQCLVTRDVFEETFAGTIEMRKRGFCPLIEVPEPHGRLGDLDKLEQMFVDIDNAPYSGFDGEEPFYSAEDAARIIRLTPTVIPADNQGGDA